METLQYASDAPLDPTCPLCRGLRPWGWPEWFGQHVGEKIGLHWRSSHLAKLPEQTCSFCCFIRDMVDHLSYEGNHKGPIALSINGYPIDNGAWLLFGDNNKNHKKEIDIRKAAIVSEQIDVPLNVKNNFSDNDKGNEKIGGSMALFRNRPYALFLKICVDPPARSRDIRIFARDSDKQLPWLQLQSCILSPLSDTSSNAIVQWVKSCLSDCQNNHNFCRSSTEIQSWGPASHMPKRLIDISDYPVIRLVEDVEQKSKYACLSHRWGGSASLITTLPTLKLRLQSILWEQLPKTFRDAIIFAHQLDVQYIWIDSLCIIQDSEEDWLEQSGLMASIYSNAFVTIAATRAQDGSTGLFSCTETQTTWNNIPLIFREQSIHPIRRDATLEEDLPLLQRGWVAQEMLISPRVLHFCEGMIIFECMEGWYCSCEDESQDHHRMNLKDPIWSSLPAGSYTTNFELVNLSEVEHFSKWISMVKHYSQLQLTFEKDRLPAISGLAHRFSQKYGCTYAAGLWLEDFPMSLLWFHETPAERNQMSTAPSWSWASTKGSLSFWGGVEAVPVCCYYTLLSIDCIPLSSYDPYGQLKSAELILSGYLLPFQVSGDDFQQQYVAIYDGHDGIKVHLDVHLDFGQDCSTIYLDVYGVPITRSMCEYDDPKTSTTKTMHTLRGLVVQRRKDGKFERVGVWVCRGKEGWNFPPPSDDWSAEKFHAMFERLERETITLV